jgi:ABC-type branched-subunit amino acid transport system substrate-binding protein
MKKTSTRAAAVLVGLAFAATACGSSKKVAEPATTAKPAATTAAPATTKAPEPTTTVAAAPAKPDLKGQLKGLKGTTPLVKLSDDFKKSMLAIDPALKDFNYGPETYDAVVIIALAVEEAKSDGIEYASKINGITRGGEKCTAYKQCLDLVKAGKDIDYDGISGPGEFSGNGEPTAASYGVLEFGPDNKLIDPVVNFKSAKAPASADVPPVPVVGTRKGDGTLKIGTILPQTGNLAFLGPPEFAALDLAMKDINAAGGVLGKPLSISKGDSGDATTDIVNQTTDRLLGEGVDAIIGAASSGVSLKVIDKITGAGIVQFSPANTSKKLSTYDDKGLYFRTAPSDVLQGAVLADIVLGDGAKNVAVINRNDAYGTGLNDDMQKALVAGGAKVVVTKTYDEKAEKFNAEVNEIKASKPDAIVIIGFEESSKILSALVEAGIGPTKIKTYGCDGNMGNALGESFEAGK